MLSLITGIGRYIITNVCHVFNQGIKLLLLLTSQRHLILYHTQSNFRNVWCCQTQ